VCLPDFEGPLDLLLHLIKINKVDITDIPVALICGQFHEYLDLMETLNLDVAGEYIYMAAYLIHLKSKLLLPRPKADVVVEPEDPREDLVQRLLEYRRLKEAAETLAEVDSVRRGMWPRKSDELKAISKAEVAELDLSEISVFDLIKTFKQVLDRFDRENPPPMIVAGEVYTVRDQIHRLLSKLSASRPHDLMDDLRTLANRREAIAAFLAILEMAKMNLLRLHQNEDGSVLLYRTTLEMGQEELEAILG
jgi:segregation and condensation protein A